MSQSLSKLYVHIVFHVKNNLVQIKKEDKQELYAYIGSIIKDNDSIPICQSLLEKTKRYIENQEEHHSKRLFKNELELFLKEYNIDYDERYLWTD